MRGLRAALRPSERFYLNEREWLGCVERAGVPAGSQIRWEPFQVPAGAPSKPRTPLAHTNRAYERVVRAGFGSPEVWRESAQRATARPQAIHALQTPRSFRENL